MLKQPTPEKAIDIIWFSVVLSFCWPLPSNSSKTRVLVYKTLQISSIISACSVLLALIYAIYLHSDDILSVSQCICIFMGISQQTIQGIICVISHDSLQYVVEEMLNCVKEARQYEKEIYCKLVAKCSIFFGSSIVCIYLTSTAFSVGPAFTSASFPCDAEYPFRVNDTPVHVIIYVQQSIVCYQCAAHLCLSMFGALLFWFTAARFECLAIEITQITNASMLVVCIKKQLYLRRYAEEVVNIFRFIVLYAVGVSTFGVTLCGIILLMDTPLIVKMQFVILSFTVLVEIYIYAWPADYLKDMSIHVSRSIYDTVWYKQTLEMQKNLLNVLVYQQPITLSIRCIIPELSLRYYCSYLSNVFSIFTALRVVVENDSE
ncbi:uncharacterized protein LOC122529379 isoform X2 [Frieseomelitta varia]|uniref:uncharacterized protein LOC122529379 isoform X2 n=1 Tax=Frieseomelitta varia TaxID=561572 RepID=UPI001CB68E1F|nr:uncharacterized protein LOC122529379 isoform X2 [Frieseomelitta varia]